MANVTGSLKKIMLLGVWYDVMADSTGTSDLAGVSVESMASSGAAVIKYTKKPQKISGHKIKMKLADYKIVCLQVRALAASGLVAPCGAMHADNSTVVGSGVVNIGEYADTDGSCTVDILFEGDSI